MPKQLIGRSIVAGFLGAALSVAGLSLLAGCSTAATRGSVMAAAKPTAQATAAFEKLKSTKGEWEGKDPQTGEWVRSASTSVSSAGSVVREIMMPGSSYEMTNMYHLDGDGVVLTHYCAMGNQPRMVARTFEGNTLHFVVDSVSNLADTKGMYMGDMKLTFVNADNIVQLWRSYDDGVLSDKHTVSMELRRVK